MIATGAHGAGYDPAAIAAREYADLRNAMCPAPDAAPAGNAAQPLAIEPVRVFDNLYFVGHRTTSAWALTTDAGIILLEAMFHDNVEDTVVAGLRKLNLDPADIKYVIVTHGHNDHFGGARHLQQTYGARIVMSAADWQHMRTWPQRGTPAPFPDQDIAVQDGDTITLGDTTVKIILTPGHTPGTLSLVFPVRDQGRMHKVGYWGGGAVSYLPGAEIEQYIAAARAWLDIDPAIDVELSNHAYIDGLLLKLDALAARQPGEENPFVTGNDGFRRWMHTIIDCAGEVLAQKKEQQ
jgi:metallo-beta-lactamase class B